MIGPVVVKRAERMLRSLPQGVLLVAAAKSRQVDEVRAVIQGGVSCIGHNYVQEAAQMIPLVDAPVRWHMIGHLQTNKAKQAVRLFDMIETVDSLRLGRALERQCADIGRVMPVLVEINSGREASKTGVLLGEAEALVRRLAELPHLQVQGLMTMGPRSGDPEDSRPYFLQTRQAFEALAEQGIPNVEMRFLSMGMSNSFHIALEEGANIVRLGSVLFGPAQTER